MLYIIQLPKTCLNNDYLSQKSGIVTGRSKIFFKNYHFFKNHKGYCILSELSMYLCLCVCVCVCVCVCIPSVTMEMNKMGKSLFSQQGREEELTLNKEVISETVKMF